MKRVFEDVLYANCWEDPAIDRKAFAIGQDDTVFCITSGGCNALAFLIDRPAKIIALDVNPHQNYMLELKMAAMKMLTHATLLEFLGQEDSRRRAHLYSVLRSELSEECRRYWDSRPGLIQAGIMHAGRYERYMGLLRTVLSLFKGKAIMRRIIETEDPASRRRIYDEEWNTPAWRLFTRALLSRRVMTLLFDGAFFRYVGESFSFGKHFAGLVQRAFTELPLSPFLSYILLKRFHRTLPVYLRNENYETIRSQLDKIEIVTDGCLDFLKRQPDDSISKFNFTNIFEWMSPEECEELLREVIRVSRHRSVMTYRNLLVPRERPMTLSRSITPDRQLADELHGEDLSFIYRNYVVERITKTRQWTESPRLAANG